MDKLLTLLESDARLSNAQLANLLDTTEDDIAARIKKYVDDGVIKGFTAIIDREKVDNEYVVAIIELSVTPKPDFGFEEIAKRITEYDEVETVYLMSGGYDLAVFVSGKNFKDIALFVSKRLSILESVVSTSTHFLLSRYKEKGFLIAGEEVDERSV